MSKYGFIKIGIKYTLDYTHNLDEYEVLDFTNNSPYELKMENLDRIISRPSSLLRYTEGSIPTHDFKILYYPSKKYDQNMILNALNSPDKDIRLYMIKLLSDEEI